MRGVYDLELGLQIAENLTILVTMLGGAGLLDHAAEL